MAPQKSPAFSFYAKDFLAGTSTMSLQEVGAYMRLLAYQWDAGSVPVDPRERSRILGCAKAQEREIWKKVGQKFALRDDVYLNERLEQERHKQVERRRRLSDNGKLGGRPAKANEKLDESNSFSSGKANGNLDERLAFSSSSSVTKEQEQRTTATPSVPPRLISGESNPRTWGKLHGEHVTGFCDWVCLPEFLFSEFCRKSGKPDDKADSGAASYVTAWARKVRLEFSGRSIGDNLKFWRERWNESHPTVKAEPKPFSIADALARDAARKAAR